MSVLVQKYGGSSLATLGQVRAVARRVAAARALRPQVAVVVSARGSATDRLVDTADEVCRRRSPRAARERDQLLATGECVAAAVLALALTDLGVPAVSLTGAQAGVRTRGRHGAGVIETVDTRTLCRLLAEGVVAVVTGFQGVDQYGDVVTLGRGGSDTSAVAVAAALGAERCEIYTDVDGVYSADPRLVPGAHVLPLVDPDVLAEMTFAGARVLHSRAVDLAAVTGVEVHIRSSANDGTGTVVMGRGEMRSLETGGMVVAVTHDLDVARVLVHARGGTDLAAEVLGVLARNAVPVDLVARSGPHEDEFRMGFTIRRSDAEEVRAALESAARGHGGDVRIDDSVGKVSLIGMGLLNRPEYVAQMTAALARAGIPTSWVSTSQLRASVTVPADRVPDAVRLLHTEFGLEREPAAGVEVPA